MPDGGVKSGRGRHVDKGLTMNIKLTAIVLAAGKGLRMGGNTPKQYMDLCGKPVLAYSLLAFENSIVDEIVIVCGEGDEKYVRKEIVDKHSIKKVTKIVAGGEERYNSVYNGLMACQTVETPQKAERKIASPALPLSVRYRRTARSKPVAVKDEETRYVFIHDGARPLITPEMIEKLYNAVQVKKAVVAACPVKDTIKVVAENGEVLSTPDRSTLWQVQTPQVFEYGLIRTSYEKLIASGIKTATDDAMAAESFSGEKVYLINTGASNIKLTTPEDFTIAEALLKK